MCKNCDLTRVIRDAIFTSILQINTMRFYIRIKIDKDKQKIK